MFFNGKMKFAMLLVAGLLGEADAQNFLIRSKRRVPKVPCFDKHWNHTPSRSKHQKRKTKKKCFCQKRCKAPPGFTPGIYWPISNPTPSKDAQKADKELDTHEYLDLLYEQKRTSQMFRPKDRLRRRQNYRPPTPKKIRGFRKIKVKRSLLKNMLLNVNKARLGSIMEPTFSEAEYRKIREKLGLRSRVQQVVKVIKKSPRRRLIVRLSKDQLSLQKKFLNLLQRVSSPRVGYKVLSTTPRGIFYTLTLKIQNGKTEWHRGGYKIKESKATSMVSKNTDLLKFFVPHLERIARAYGV